jgi:hypothetical protein
MMDERKGWQASEGIRRDFRVLDQSITAFSILRDRYRRRSTALTVAMVAAGVALVLLTFGAEEVLMTLGLDGAGGRVWIGIFGSLVFVASLVELRVDWQGRASLYAWAADRFADLKLDYGSYMDGPEPSEVREAELRGQYQSAVSAAPRIPERDFLKLKQAHLQKVALSKMVSRSPGTPMAVLRWRLARAGRLDEQ